MIHIILTTGSMVSVNCILCNMEAMLGHHSQPGLLLDRFQFSLILVQSCHYPVKPQSSFSIRSIVFRKKVHLKLVRNNSSNGKGGQKIISKVRNCLGTPLRYIKHYNEIIYIEVLHFKKTLFFCIILGMRIQWVQL